jgi:hypothetical protein
VTRLQEGLGAVRALAGESGSLSCPKELAFFLQRQRALVARVRGQGEGEEEERRLWTALFAFLRMPPILPEGEEEGKGAVGAKAARVKVEH